MINLDNVQKAVNSNDLQFLRQLGAFLDYFENAYVIGDSEKIDVTELGTLLQNLNTNDYSIAAGRSGNISALIISIYPRPHPQVLKSAKPLTVIKIFAIMYNVIKTRRLPKILITEATKNAKSKT